MRSSAAGWDFVLLDTTAIHDKAGFLDLCATAFDLPRWFGRNWDALADSLSDRSTGEPEIVFWAGLQQLLEHDHDTVDVALQIFTEDITNSGQLRVLIHEPADAEDAGPAQLTAHPCSRAASASRSGTNHRLRPAVGLPDPVRQGRAPATRPAMSPTTARPIR